jgi:flagellar basal-body rod modification protein FlgD
MSVMSVKRSTHAFSSAQQTPNLKSEATNTASAGDFAKAFGEQSVGDIANKVADPNWVDPTKKVRAVGNPTLDKDAFMKLMLTQMKNQDPTKPMESHEMAAQLAQFTSLEQLNNINSTLESMKNSQTPSTNFQALAFIGKKVSGDSSKLTRAAGDTNHAFNFELLGEGARVKVNIKDAAGTVVRKLELAGLKKGENSITWNGLQDDGTPARPGEYKFTVEAQSNTGAKVYAKTSFEGRITGLNYTAQGPVLMVGSQTIKLSDVKKIEDPGMEQPAAMMAQAKPQAAVAAPVKEAATEAVPPAEEPEQGAGNINDIPMSRDLQSQLAKVMK